MGSEVQQNITVELGKNANLTCRAPNNNIRVVEWSRADLRAKNVFLYRDGRFVPNDQHPSFKDRVDLQDRQMKDGNVSLILKNVTINDAGTYKCQVFLEETRKLQSIKNISLSVVVPPGQPGGDTEDGSVGLIVGLLVFAVLVIAVHMFYCINVYITQILPFILFIFCNTTNHTNITAESGQKKVTLPCRAPNNNIRSVEWSRADLGDEYVFLYKDKRFEPDNQHPSFKNRVDLQDTQMKDGDVSLILKNVTINDTGTYKCQVFMSGKNLQNNNPISIIHLHVDPPGE
ncbi:unnamed protein product [Oreochromis niloticus]|nr:unnamed protein product [Mustela putorius furo]